MSLGEEVVKELVAKQIPSQLSHTGVIVSIR
jgi:hypothetical protein